MNTMAAPQHGDKPRNEEAWSGSCRRRRQGEPRRRRRAIIYLFFVERYVAGLTSGSVKG
jgi:hypothetical protein